MTEKNEVFVYRYSAKQNREAERIRQKYLPRKESKLDILRRLDRRVQNAGVLQGLTVGVIGCLIFGVGMCFGLDVLDGADFCAWLLGGIGTLVMIPAYPLYRYIARKTRAELTPEILRLSEEIMDSEKKED